MSARNFVIGAALLVGACAGDDAELDASVDASTDGAIDAGTCNLGPPVLMDGTTIERIEQVREELIRWCSFPAPAAVQFESFEGRCRDGRVYLRRAGALSATYYFTDAGLVGYRELRRSAGECEWIWSEALACESEPGERWLCALR